MAERFNPLEIIGQVERSIKEEEFTEIIVILFNKADNRFDILNAGQNDSRLVIAQLELAKAALIRHNMKSSEVEQ